MAEADVPEISLTCESVNIGIAMVRGHLRQYEEFLMDNAKIHEGILSPCCHTEEHVNIVSQLINRLEKFKELIKSHKHVTTAENLIRATPGRRGNKVAPKHAEIQMPKSSDLRDSGVSLTNSEDIRGKYFGNSGLDIAGAGEIGNVYSAVDTNIRPQCLTSDDNMDQPENIKCKSKQLTRKLGIKDDKNQQHTEDYSYVDEKSQTRVKTRYDPSQNTPSCKDDSRMKKDDNRKSGDS